MTELKKKRCVPCEGGTEKMTAAQAKDLMPQVVEWSLSDEATVLSREFVFKNFKDALLFVDKVGALAEEEWHHPDIALSWGKVTVSFTTHSIRGLSENDFIMAAKVNEL